MNAAEKSAEATRALARLEAAAASWHGTPFCEFSALKGKGVCCHALPLEIYFEAGWLPRFDYPMSAPRSAGAAKVEAFTTGAAAKYFARAESAIAGDTLHFRLGRTSHFVLQLGTKYIHALHGGGALYAVSLQPAWMKRLHAIWRPVQLKIQNSTLKTF